MNGARSNPPRLASWLLRWQCVPTQLEALEGDLLELYERRLRARGPGHANARYWRDVVSACARQGRLMAWLVRARRSPVSLRLALWIASFLVAIVVGRWVDRALYLLPLSASFFYIDFVLGPKVFRAWSSLAREVCSPSREPGGGGAVARPGLVRVESWLLLLLGALGGFPAVAYALSVELVRWAVRGAGSAQPYLRIGALIYVGILLLLGATFRGRGVFIFLFASGVWAVIARVRGRRTRSRSSGDGVSADG